MTKNDGALAPPSPTFAGTCYRPSNHLLHLNLTKVAEEAIMAAITTPPMTPSSLAAAPTVTPLPHPSGETVQEAQRY